MLRRLRTPLNIAVALVALPVAVGIELVSAILAVIGIVAVVVHLRADAGRQRGDLLAGARSRVALWIGLGVMWVLDRAPFRDPARQERRGNP